MYEGGVRVPGVLEWPAVIKEPATTSAISVTTDILPTLADSFPEIVEEMQTQLHNWQESVLNSLSGADYK